MSLFPHSLHKALQRAAKPIVKKRGFGETRILSDWPQIAGEHLAAMATPLKLTYPRNKQDGGTLTLSVHPAYALEVQQLTPMMLDKIASYVGFRAIDRIIIEQSYHALPEVPHEQNMKPDPVTASNESDTLTATLERIKQLRASNR